MSIPKARHIRTKKTAVFLFGLLSAFFPGTLHGQSPEWNWVVPVHSASAEAGLDVAADPDSGYVYMAGYFNRDLDQVWGDPDRPGTDFSDSYGLQDGFVAKYDSAGNYRWAFKIGSAGNDEVRSVSVGGDGSIYITGYVGSGLCRFAGTSSLTPDSSFTNTGRNSFFLARYNSDGALLWVRNSDGSADDVYGNDVIASVSGIYAAGQYQGILNLGPRSVPDYEPDEDVFVAKYTPAGNLEWVLSAGGDGADIPNDLACDGNDLYLIGEHDGETIGFRDTAGTVVTTLTNPGPGKQVIYVTCFDSLGNPGWSRQISSSGDNEGTGICMDRDSLYITGAIGDLGMFPAYAANPVTVSAKKDIFLASLSRDNGLTGWVRTVECTVVGDETARTITVDQPGNLYISGEYQGTLDFHGYADISASSNTDIFLASYSSEGIFRWAKTSGGNGALDVPRGMSTDRLANLYLTGSYDLGAYFDSILLPGDALGNVFLAGMQIACRDAVGGTALAAPDHVCPGDTARIELTGYRGTIRWQSSPHDSGMWTDIEGAYAPTLDPVPSGTTDYRAFLSDGSCAPDSSGVVTLTVYPAPRVSVTADTTVCQGDTAELYASGEGSFQWSPATYLDDPSIAGPVAIPLSDIDYSLVLTDGNGCRDSAGISLKVYARPAAYAGEDMELYYRFDTVLHAELPAEGEGEWMLVSGSAVFEDAGNPVTVVRGLSPGENILRWSVSNGVCPTVSDEVSIFVNELYTPNIITPNDDNRNDRFVVRGLENAGTVRIVIFNRWGNEVFRTDDYQNDWEGRDRNGNRLPADTYYYILSLENGGIVKGYLIIRR